MSRKLINLLVIVVLALGMPASVFAQAGDTPELPFVDVSQFALETPVEVAPELAAVTGDVEIVVRLVDEPLAVAVGQGAKQKGAQLNLKQQRAYLKGLADRQSGLMQQINALGGQELGRVSRALNAVIVKIDSAQLSQLAGLPGIRSINPLGKYELDLSETVPYIGATAVQNLGFDGTGVKVAVLDSGIDYTHYNLGGSGSVAEYNANDPTIIEPGSFPTSKVIGGYDFVGAKWPDSERTQDPDPLDTGVGGGHGTHVADIIAGKSLDGVHKGVAPGASLYAVKVCSSVSSSCNGIALLLGMDFALDPNGDGNLADAVDVINMSLGSSYGQREDDLSFASANAVRFGVVVVVSAGNSADRPYIVGSPSSTPEVISVAQTQVPSAGAIPLKINSPANIAGIYANTATVDWAPIGAGFTGDVVQVGLACPGVGPALPDLTGKVALIDRGTCSVSLKTDAAGAAGASGVLIGLVAAGDAVSFSFGGGTHLVPTLVITKPYADLIKANINAPVNVTVSSDYIVPLAGSVVGSSSRGPSYSFSQIKPDIGAPGASVSAVFGTGNGQEAFGGTSGAAPMVSGAAAQLIQAYPNRGPVEIKSLLMNTGETTIYTNPATLPGVLAPITRIGGGEVRVDRALASKSAAWDAADLSGSLSFGYNALTASTTFQKKVVLRNYSNKAVTYSVTPNFRYADDAANGAVTVVAPKSVKVNANSSATFHVQLKVDASKLPAWNMSGGFVQGDGSRLQAVEYDGYLTIAGGADTIHMAWQILPHKAAEVTPATSSVALTGGVGSLALSNTGVADGSVDVFSLLGTNGRLPVPSLPADGENQAVIDLKFFGARLAGANIQFAINTFGTRSHPAYPAEFDVYLDTNRDGVDDYVVYNAELGTFASSGQTVVNVVNLKTGSGGAFFFADADLRSGNIILTAPLSALGLAANTTFDVSVYAFDNYFSGNLTDAIVGMTYTPGQPRYYSNPAAFTIPTGVNGTLPVYAYPGGELSSPSQTGLLLMYRNAREQREADAILVTP